jgi:hypothetical protein
MNKYINIRFRPSGHSEPGTLLAIFKDKAHAEAASRMLSGQPHNWQHCQNGHLVIDYSGEDFGYGKSLRQKLREAGATKISEVWNYQELTVEFPVPKNTCAAARRLILNRDASILYDQLAKARNTTKVETEKNTVFTYLGDLIYLHHGISKGAGHFRIGKFRIRPDDSVKVTVMWEEKE